MRTGIIYKYVNIINNKVYIGKTTVKNRNYGHKYSSREEKTKFYYAIRKYGWENFKYSVLELITDNIDDLNYKLSELEKYYVYLYNSQKNGYNSTSGGEGVCGFHHSKESKKKMSEKRKSLYSSGKLIALKKIVYKLDKTNNIIEKFESLTQAKKETKVKQIISCCHMKRKSAGGFRWIYEEDYLNIDKRNEIFNFFDVPLKYEYLKKCCRKVYQLTRNGEFIKEFNSIQAAATSIKRSTGHISKVCKHKKDFASIYRWVYKEEYDNKEKREELLKYYEKYNNKNIIQLTINGEYINEFIHSGEAFRSTNINYQGILDCCKGKLKTSGGFIWKYKKDYNVENIPFKIKEFS